MGKKSKEQTNEKGERGKTFGMKNKYFGIDFRNK